MKPRLPDRRVQDILAAIASPTRQGLLAVFWDGRERAAGEVVEASGLAQSTVSTHLAQLERCGLLLRRKEGREVYFRPNRVVIVEFLEKLAGYLRKCC